MATSMAAKQIGEEWLAFVTEIFGLKDGIIRPQVQEEYQRLADSDAIRQERELWRDFIDEMIERILDCPAQQRGKLLAVIDIRALAFVQDRIRCGTELITALVHRGLNIGVGEGEAPLYDYFRLLLLQQLPAANQPAEQPDGGIRT